MIVVARSLVLKFMRVITAVRFAAARVNAIFILARVQRTRGNLPNIEKYRPYFSLRREKIASSAARSQNDSDFLIHCSLTTSTNCNMLLIHSKTLGEVSHGIDV